MHCASASVGEACDSIERRCTTGLQRWTLNRTLNSLPALQSCTEIAAVSAKRVKVRPALELKPAKNRRLPRKLLTRSPALLRNLPRSWQNSKMLPRFSMVALCVEAKRVWRQSACTSQKETCSLRHLGNVWTLHCCRSGPLPGRTFVLLRSMLRRPAHPC